MTCDRAGAVRLLHIEQGHRGGTCFAVWAVKLKPTVIARRRGRLEILRHRPRLSPGPLLLEPGSRGSGHTENRNACHAEVSTLSYRLPVGGFDLVPYAIKHHPIFPARTNQLYSHRLHVFFVVLESQLTMNGRARTGSNGFISAYLERPI